MKQKRAYQYRFYPTSEREHVLAHIFGRARYICNWALQLCTDAYYKDHRTLVKIDKRYPPSKRCFDCGHILDSFVKGESI